LYAFQVTINVCSHKNPCVPDLKLKISTTTNELVHNAAKKWKDYFNDLKEIRFFWIITTNLKKEI
jgi:hypothetical protein